MKKNLLFNAVLTASMLGLAGCAALQGIDKAADKPADTTQPTIQFGPLLAPPVPPPAIQSPQQARTEPKVYPGTGVLIKQIPAAQPAQRESALSIRPCRDKPWVPSWPVAATGSRAGATGAPAAARTGSLAGSCPPVCPPPCLFPEARHSPQVPAWRRSAQR